MSTHPKARTDGILNERVADELVVYDQHSHVAHSLTTAAASVWELCDGTRTPAEIAAELSLEPELVERALGELSANALFDETLVSPLTRRQAGRRIAQVGGAAFAAPLIYSVVIAPAMAAASTLAACDRLTCSDYGSGVSEAAATLDAIANANAICSNDNASVCRSTSTCNCAVQDCTDNDPGWTCHCTSGLGTTGMCVY